MEEITMSEFITTYGASIIILLVTTIIAILATVFFTGIGRRVIKRIKQQWLYKKGKHVNTVFIGNNGVANELFLTKNDDGSFTYNKGRYAVDRKKTILLDGIPTQINVEGISEPVDVAGYDTSDKMSTAELEQIIMHNEAGNLMAFLNSIKPYIIVGVVAVVILAAASLYFNYQIFDVLVQGAVPGGIGSELAGGR